MTNREKYAGFPHDAAKEFALYCSENKCNADNCVICQFKWLDLEAKENPSNCPYCGKACNVVNYESPVGRRYKVGCSECSYQSQQFKSEQAAIRAHNLAATAIISGRDKMMHDLLKVCEVMCPGTEGYNSRCATCECKRLCDMYTSLKREIAELRERIELNGGMENKT